MTLAPSLAVDIAAAYLDRRAYHHALCDSADGGECSCAFGGLLAALVDVVLPGFADAAERLGLEGKPFWAKEYPGLLMECAEAAAVGTR